MTDDWMNFEDDGEEYSGEYQDTAIAVAIAIGSSQLPEHDYNGFILDDVPHSLTNHAKQAIDDRDAVGLLCLLNNIDNMSFLVDNSAAFWKLGCYEEAILHAHSASRTNNRNIDYELQRAMWKRARQESLWSLCDPLPSDGPFQIYRGVLGRTEQKRVIRGMSWTGSLDVARFFSDRLSHLSDDDLDPAVYETVVEKEDVIAYLNESYRKEEEYIVHIRAHHVITRL